MPKTLKVYLSAAYNVASSTTVAFSFSLTYFISSSSTYVVAARTLRSWEERKNRRDATQNAARYYCAWLQPLA